jgi:pteridine reductase
MSKKTILQPKVAIITGAARRIGAEIARFLHANGLNIIVHYHTSQRAAEQLCQTLNKHRSHSAVALCADLSEPFLLSSLIKKSAKIWGKIDILVNNAAYFKSTKIGKISESTWNALLDTNLKAPFFLSQAAAPYLAKQKGCIINIADIHGEHPMHYYPVYSISKAGLLMLTKTLARELAPTIRVNAISPGPTLWPEGNNALSPFIKKEIIGRTALKQQGDPQDIAKTVLYLINGVNHMTGQNIILDGGRSLLF